MADLIRCAERQQPRNAVTDDGQHGFVHYFLINSGNRAALNICLPSFGPQPCAESPRRAGISSSSGSSMRASWQRTATRRARLQIAFHQCSDRAVVIPQNGCFRRDLLTLFLASFHFKQLRFPLPE